MSELDRLLNSLFEEGPTVLTDIKFFPGDDPELTADDISREAARAQLAHTNGLSFTHRELDETSLITIDLRKVKGAIITNA